MAVYDKNPYIQLILSCFCANYLLLHLE